MRHSARLEGAAAEGAGAISTSDVHTPNLISPPGTKTPPTDPSKRAHSHNNVANDAARDGSTPVDADALNKALHQFEDAVRTRERTPGESPKRKRQRVYGDRCVDSAVKICRSGTCAEPSTLDSYPPDPARTCTQATAFSTTTARLRRPRSRTRSQLRVSFMSRKVSNSGR